MGVDICRLKEMTIHEKLEEIQESINAFGEFQKEFTDAFNSFCELSAEMTNKMMSVVLFNMAQDDRDMFIDMMNHLDQEVRTILGDDELEEEWEEFPTNNNEEE